MMEVAPKNAAGRSTRAMNWEEFFRNYRNPDFIPGFTILNRLGSGAFGEVYKARKTSIGKDYAIKFLRVQDERLQEQVLRELEAVDHFAHVDHPNVVSVEDRGEVCGIPYILMGYAGDETLKTLLRSGPLGADRAANLFLQVLRGVAALHQHGIIHFDLKPGNVFIKGDVARVGDYGLSKLMSESRATLSMGRGTPYYMAPEMLRRRGDARSDVYSLGVIFYEMLLGEVPFKGDTEWEILRKHEADDVRVPASIPAGLREFLLRSLEKKPNLRFSNATDQLEAFLAATAASFAADTSTGTDNGNPAPGKRRPKGHGGAWRNHRSYGAGRVIGRLARKGQVNMDRVRVELGDVIDRMKLHLEDVREGAATAYRESADTQARTAPIRSPLAFASSASFGLVGGALGFAGRGLSLVGRGVRKVGRVLTAPLRLLDWMLHNLLVSIFVLVLTAILCFVVHLGLQSAIL